jgi:hypothetical protein
MRLRSEARPILVHLLYFHSFELSHLTFFLLSPSQTNRKS